MTNKIFYLSILIFSFISCKTETKIKSEILEKSKIVKIDSLANRYLELNRFSGVILVTNGDTIIYNTSFGLADYENKVSFSYKTAFKIGEISELVTSNIVREMAKKDKFQLSDKISNYIPEIQSDLTINDLLNHKTDLPTIQSIQEQNPELKYSTVEYVNLATQSSDKSDKSDLD